MSFLTGTQAELLYCMPATGASNTGTNSTSSGALISMTGGATSPAYFLPAYFFSDTYGIGKSLLIQGGGVLLNGPATQTLRFAIYLDTAIGTQAATPLVATGAFSPFGAATSATGSFMFEVLITCTSVGTAGTLNAVGRLFTGASGTAGTATGNTFLMGAASQPTFNNATGYFVDVYANFGATTTTQAVTLTNMLVWGLN